MGRKERIYALYKGDEFLYMGTKTEIAEFLHISRKSVHYLTTPACHKRNRGNARIAIKVEEEE